MLSFLLAHGNVWFSAGLALLLLLALLEMLCLIFGLNLLALFGDVDGPEIAGAGPSGLLGFTGLKSLPFAIWLVFFLGTFGLSGLILNTLSSTVVNGLLPLVISVPVAIAGGLVITGRIGRLWHKWLPQIQTSALGAESFAGQVARITVGTASKGSPAEATFSDEFGQKHFVMVEPADEHLSFSQHSQVILVDKHQSIWMVIPYSEH